MGSPFSGGGMAFRLLFNAGLAAQYGQPPFKGTLKHHGWVAAQIRMPEPSPAMDPRVIAPAEVGVA